MLNVVTLLVRMVFCTVIKRKSYASRIQCKYLNAFAFRISEEEVCLYLSSSLIHFGELDSDTSLGSQLDVSAALNLSVFVEYWEY